MREELPARDLRLADLAARQHGVVAYWQLFALGLSRSAIERRVRAGRLHRVYRSVYAVGHIGLSHEGRDMAAVLACGAGAVLSHWSAGSRWKLLRPLHGLVHVSVPRDCRIPRIRTHQVASLHARDCTKRDGIPITTVPRTLLDIAGVADERTLRRAVNQAARSGWLNLRAIDDTLQRNPRRKGTKQLRAVIAAVNPSTHRTRSDLEVAFLQLCRRYGIPTPVVNGKVLGIEVDFRWPGANLIVELDGYEYHRTAQEFENDRRRDAYLKKHGYEVLRVSDGWLNDDPEGVADTVKILLAYPD
jgi:predicted transcriptional regulator of viral defense system